MKVVITGGAGYLGTLLVRQLAEIGSLIGKSGQPAPIDRIVVLDAAVESAATSATKSSSIPVEYIGGSIADRALLGRIIQGEAVSVFHLAALLTGVTERDLDAAMMVNVEGTRNVLDALRRCGGHSRFVMTSSVTVYRRDAHDTLVNDGTVVRPSTVYGLTKAMSEQMTAAYRLARAVDGRCARLSTVIIRPRKIGVSAGAAISDVLRDISLGRPCEVLAEPHVKSALIDYGSCIAGLIRLHNLESEALEDNPSVNFPGVSASIADMIDAASAAARRTEGKPGHVQFSKNDFVQNTIESWPTFVDGSRAERLGITCKLSLEQICVDFITDYNEFWRHQHG